MTSIPAFSLRLPSGFGNRGRRKIKAVPRRIAAEVDLADYE
jgi:hypothetical protein